MPPTVATTGWLIADSLQKGVESIGPMNQTRRYKRAALSQLRTFLADSAERHYTASSENASRRGSVPTIRQSRPTRAPIMASPIIALSRFGFSIILLLGTVGTSYRQAQF
jgi:hypothetical protein